MKKHVLVLGLVAFCMLFFCAPRLEAGFTNNGTMQSRSLNLSIGGTLDNNGKLIGTESANIRCSTLTGTGLILSPQIALKTNIFAYTGTIECDGKCVICVSQPFDEEMFTRRGKGEFIIVVDPSLSRDCDLDMGLSIHDETLTIIQE